MKQKALNIILAFMIALILVGIIIWVIGFYYSFFKAGIPYQDPTQELQIKYEIYYNIGKIFTKIGSITTVCSGIICAVLLLIKLKYFLNLKK